MKKEFFRTSENKIIGGVCGGIGNYFNIDPTIVRLIFAVLFISGCSISDFIFVLYLIMWVITKEES